MMIPSNDDNDLENNDDISNQEVQIRKVQR